MNLQPVPPAAIGCLVHCEHCGRRCTTPSAEFGPGYVESCIKHPEATIGVVYADIDAAPGTYYCRNCAHGLIEAQACAEADEEVEAQRRMIAERTHR